MASTYSDLKIQLMATGENSGTWGEITNTNLGTAIEEAITGSADVAFSSADVTLTLSNVNTTQTARNLRLNLTGTSGGNRNLIVPAIEKIYIINNGLANQVTVKNAAGTGIAVPAGKTMYVYNNGTNVVDAITHLTSLTLGSALPVASGGTGVTASTGTGNVVLSTSPTLVTPALGTPSSGNLANCTFPTLNQSTTGNAATATALQTARTIGGVSFNGTANINLPGVNTAGNQNTSGNAATATNATNATNVTGTTTASIPTTALGSGTANSTTFLRGDRTFATLTIPTASIPAGSVMLFVQTAAPTGWTKSTTHNNKALRVVNGTAGTGGTVAFTTAFASQAVSGTIANATATNQNATATNIAVTATNIAATQGGTVANHTLSVAQLASHGHSLSFNFRPPGASFSSSAADFNSQNSAATFVAANNNGSSNAHSHTFTGASHNHTQNSHNHTQNAHTHTQNAHNHTFTGTAINLAVQYVDVIICTKD